MAAANNQTNKGASFRALHQGPAFVIPNPWDAGSARLLEGLGFAALATTSSGFAQTLGRLDGQVTLDELLAHCQLVSAATTIPVTVDLENGFADQPEGVAEAVTRVAQTGVVGASIEDYSGTGIYPFAQAVERIQAAVEAAASLDFAFTLTARAENLLHGVDDFDDTLARLQAFAKAGADVVYSPGVTTLEEVVLTRAAVDKPINVLAPFFSGATVAQLAEAGATRISIGGALANAACGVVLRAGREMLETGGFDWLGGMASRADLRALLGKRPD